MDNQPPPPPSSPPPLDDDSKPKRTRARDRYERRKLQHATPRPPGALPRQLKVPQRVNLPPIRLPRSGRVLIGLAAAIVFVVVLVVALGRLRGGTQETPPNALWLGTEWTYQNPATEEAEAASQRQQDLSDIGASVGDGADSAAVMTALVQALRDQKIGTVYAYVTYLQFNGTWRNEDQFDNVKAFVKAFKQAYPEGHLDGLIGVPTSDDTHPDRLNDLNLQQQVADLAGRFVNEFGFDGVFLDVEPVWDGDQNFLALLRAVRSSVGMTTQISAAIPPDWSPAHTDIPLPPLITPGTEWSKDYKQSVALLVNHMAVMVFNSGLSTAADYEQWVAYQVKTYAQAVAALDTDTDVLIAVPTFDSAPPGHDPAVENVSTAVQGINLGVQQAGDAGSYVSGLAIYADWTTDGNEWADWRNSWLAGK